MTSVSLEKKCFLNINEMDEFYIKVQILLMKKDREYGDELKYLTSRTTESNIANINDLCRCISEIFQKYHLLPGVGLETDQECAQALKYLILNTNFEVQNYLAEDSINGHLVDMCPPLSPYLLMQIIWKLQYDDILIRSLLFLPIQLCNEILDITRKCLEELEFERAINFIFHLLRAIYKKFQLTNTIGSQIVGDIELSTAVNTLLIQFQEIAYLLSDPKFLRLSEVPELKKYERLGLLLKRSFQMIKDCLEHSTQEITFPMDVEKFYKITFGRELFVTCEKIVAKQYMTDINQELVNLLLRQIKVIDCKIYLGWAELEDDKNNKISLQRSIGIECYYFLEFLKNFKDLPQNDHMIECLHHFSSKPESKEINSILSLQEIKHNINEGRKEFMKELIHRYKEWEHSVDCIDFVDEHKSLLDEDDCLSLLEYLTFVITQLNETDLKQHVYTIVMKIVLLQSIPNIFEIVVRYITKHDGRNCLEDPNTEDLLKSFITKNTNLRSAKTLKTVLLFLLKSPEKILTILVKISIGHCEYKNIMITASDMLLLSPIMNIYENDNRTILVKILKNICIENTEWDVKKFATFINVMLDDFVIEADDLINQVFIPYLQENTFNTSNMNSVLNNIRKLEEKCTEKTNVSNLLISLGKRLSDIRKYTTILSKYTKCEMFTRIIRIIEYFLHEHPNNLNNTAKRTVIIELEDFLEPMDKPYFAPLWELTREGLDISDIIQDYERRCFLIVSKIKADKELSKEVRDSVSSLSFLREDFLRHVIMRSTETEYIRHGIEISILHFRKFKWNNEIDAYNNYSRLTIEACCLYLEYPSIGPTDSFVFLIKCLTRFTKMFLKIDRLKISDIENIYRSLANSINLLNESIKNSAYFDLYMTLLTHINNFARSEPIKDTVQDLLQALEQFESQCSELLVQDHEPKTPSAKISRFCIIHDFISNCIKMPAKEAYECITKMNHRLFP